MKWPEVMPSKMEVLWCDAHSKDEWHDKLDDQLRVIVSSGYLIKETADAVLLAGMCDLVEGEPMYACVQTIPKACIKKKRIA